MSRRPSALLALVLFLASLTAPGRAQLLAAHDVDPTLVAPRWGLLFVPNASLAIDAASSSPLDHLDDQEIAWIAPLGDLPAVQVHARAARRVLLDDVDADVPWLHDWEDIDALDLPRYGWPPTSPDLEDLVLSVQDAFGAATESGSTDADGAVDGSLFRVTRDASGAKALRFFLTEKQILTALGHDELSITDGVDVDAFTQDAFGNVYLSFRHDEWVVGSWLGDEGLVCIPASAISYDGLLDVASVQPSSAVVVWDAADAAAMVAQAGLEEADGDAIVTLGDLQAVSVDPGGGTFPSRTPIPGFGSDAPNLLFAGQRIGASVLSTRAGGTVARLDGIELASSPIDGAALGLDAGATTKTTHDLNALCATRAHEPAPCLDVADDWVTLGSDPLEVESGGHAPLEPVVIRLDVDAPSSSPGVTPSIPAPVWAGYPHLHALGPVAVLVVADAAGRATWLAPAPPAGADLATWVTLQSWGLHDMQLSTPARVWCATP